MSEHCPFCEKHIEWWLKTLREEPDEFHQKRIEKGFWASIEQVHDEQWLMNRVLDDGGSLKLRMPITVNMESRTTLYGRFWCYSLAERRDEELNKKLQHFWILSGGCSMSWMTPICCELANVTSEEEAIEWERENLNL